MHALSLLLLNIAFLLLLRLSLLFFLLLFRQRFFHPIRAVHAPTLLIDACILMSDEAAAVACCELL
jgi:hypothetical protein